MKKLISKIVCAVFALSCGGQIFAQDYSWLDAKPLPSWNERSRAILQTKKIAADELTRCRVVVRPATLPVDDLLVKSGRTLVGDAQVFGKTMVVTTAESFDGMCRPLEFQTYVFVGNRLAGTLSPAPMNSRTDKSLVNVKLLNEKSLTADYVRYGERDALCCPSKLNRVSFVINPDGQNFLLKPDFVSESAYNTSEAKDSGGETNAASLVKGEWRWNALETPNENLKIENPGNYILEFKPDGRAQILADCNRGGGSYKIDGANITFPGFATTRKACPAGSLDNRFLQLLRSARTFRLEGNTLFIAGAGDNGTMTFYRAVRQN